MIALEVRQALGRAGNERGAYCEQLVIEALRRRRGRPKWIHGVRLAGPKLDRRGVDVVVSSDVGLLFLQVKASKRSVERQRSNYERRWIAIVWASPLDSLDVVRSRAAGELSRLRQRVLERRAARE